MPFDPLADITWDEVHWASDPSWTPPSDGGAVSSWRDGSGNSRNATQATGGNQPLYRASVAALNNKPAVEFDGSNDYLANGTSYTRAQPFTVVVVVNGWSTGAGAPNLVGFTGLSGRMGRGYPAANGISIFAGGSDYIGSVASDTGSHLVTAHYSGATSKIGHDGPVTAIGTSVSPGTTGITTGLTVGAYDNNAAGNPAAAKVAFVGVYNGDFTANAQYGAFKTWVASFYGITVGAVDRARHFAAASSDYIKYSTGAFGSNTFTYGTVAVLFRATTLPGDVYLLVKALSNESDGGWYLAVNSSGVLSNAWYFYGVSTGTGPTISSGVWYCLLLTKATGTAAPRFHLYNYTTATWAHTNRSSSEADGTNGFVFNIPNMGRWATGGAHFDGDIAAAAFYQGWVPDDAGAEAAGLHQAGSAWTAAAANSTVDQVWLLNQAAIATAVTDSTGGGADQTAISGTSVVSGPVGYSETPVTTAWLNPASDVTVNSWTTDTGGTTNLYQAIDEDTASDTDYIRSPLGAFTASYYECGLESQVGDAGLSTNHVPSYRYQASLGAGSDLTVSLRQGTSTEIAAWTHNNISTAWTTADQTLTGTQADNITYPTDLRLRFAPNADGPATPALVASSTGSVSNLTGQASTALTVTSGMAAAIQVGHYMVAWVGVDNSGASGARPGLTVTDSRSNSWTVTTGALIDPGAANAGAACYIAYARITTAYQTSDTITFNWTVGGTSTAAKSISVSAFSGVASTSPVAVAEVAASGTSTAFTISITPTAADQLVVVAGAIEGASGDAWTNDADTTNGSWSALTEVSTGNTGATDITLQGAYKVVTASGAQTWNSTITSRDWCANAIVFAPQPAARVQVSWAGLTIPFAAPPPTDRPSARIIYQPAVQRAALW